MKKNKKQDFPDVLALAASYSRLGPYELARRLDRSPLVKGANREASWHFIHGLCRNMPYPADAIVNDIVKSFSFLYGTDPQPTTEAQGITWLATTAASVVESDFSYSTRKSELAFYRDVACDFVNYVTEHTRLTPTMCDEDIDFFLCTPNARIASASNNKTKANTKPCPGKLVTDTEKQFRSYVKQLMRQPSHWSSAYDYTPVHQRRFIVDVKNACFDVRKAKDSRLELDDMPKVIDLLKKFSPDDARVMQSEYDSFVSSIKPTKNAYCQSCHRPY